MKNFVVTAIGDCLMYEKLCKFSEPKYLDMVKLIQESDLAVANLETLLHNYKENGYLSTESGGSWARAPPDMASELMWLRARIYRLGIEIRTSLLEHRVD